MSREIGFESDRPDGNKEEHTPANDERIKINEGLYYNEMNTIHLGKRCQCERQETDRIQHTLDGRFTNE
jgi:hypothetical protein